MPIDNSAAAEGAQRACFVTHTNFVGDEGGTTFRINEFATGSMKFTHRTETLDYVLHLSGEIDCELEKRRSRAFEARRCHDSARHPSHLGQMGARFRQSLHPD